MENIEAEENEEIPEHILDKAASACNSLIPQRSSQKYEKQYAEFRKWCDINKVKLFKEEVFLAFLSEQSIKYKPPTLWSKYSVLKTMCKIKLNLDIGKYFKLTAFLKRQNLGYKSKKSKVFTQEEITKFMEEAPNEIYLMIKVATIFGLAGACRREELTKITLDDIQDKQNLILVKIPDSKNHTARNFVITSEVNNGTYLQLYHKYLNIRPHITTHRRLFVYYKNGKCTCQCVGINTFGKMPSEIAAFLGLPNPELYTGHSFRRSSATILADNGEQITNIKRLGGWKSTAVAEGYIEESLKNKKEISNKILQLPCSTTTISTTSTSVEVETDHNNVLKVPDIAENSLQDNIIPTGTDADRTYKINPKQVILSSIEETASSALTLHNASHCSFTFNIVNNNQIK